MRKSKVSKFFRRFLRIISSFLLKIADGLEMTMTDVRNLIGHKVQGWTIWEILGTGADGIVYVGEKGGIQAAVKLFFPEQLERYGLEEQTQRLELQLQLRGKKHHPNLVEIYEGGFDTEYKTLYLVMEFVPGKSLDRIISTLPRQHIGSLIRQLASAAKFLEEQDLCHRDIKPANIVVSDDFQKLTLLDLGVVIRPPDAIDTRLSKDDFVASVRYSPREFVWRDEEGTDPDAWRAVTFYQIGATLHDMIMRYPMFQGCTPAARLFEAVKLQPPDLDSDDTPSWLVNLAKACLIKNWRDRLKYVTWDSFDEATLDDFKSELQALRILQIRSDESQLKKKEEQNPLLSNKSREQDLWNLQRGLFLELRQFLMSNDVFPKFSGSHRQVAGDAYELSFIFEDDADRLFPLGVGAHVRLSTEGTAETATEIAFVGKLGSTQLVAATWTEVFSVERSAQLCEKALIQVAAQIIRPS